MFNWFKERKKANKRKAFLAGLSLDNRIKEFTRAELYDYFIKFPNTANYTVVKSLFVRLDKHVVSNSILIDSFAYKLISKEINDYSKAIIGMAFLNPLPKGCDPRFLEPSSMERTRRNAYVLDAYFIISNMFDNKSNKDFLKLLELNMCLIQKDIFLVNKPSKALIKEVMLKNGYKEKEQPDGSVDLNPYVYDAVYDLLEKIKQ